MSALAQEASDAADSDVNEVRLVGRLGADPEERLLPSGDTLWTFRVNVGRPPGRRAGQSGGPGATQRSDSLDCAVWSGRPRRTVATWSKGDLVEVSGSVRKRFFQAGGATSSRVEIEVSRARVIRRAATG
jgi:single-strand DNA-binding protein